MASNQNQSAIVSKLAAIRASAPELRVASSTTKKPNTTPTSTALSEPQVTSDPPHSGIDPKAAELGAKVEDEELTAMANAAKAQMEEGRRKRLRARAKAELQKTAFEPSLTPEEQERAAAKSTSRHEKWNVYDPGRYTDEMRQEGKERRAAHAAEQRKKARAENADRKKRIRDYESQNYDSELEETPAEKAANESAMQQFRDNYKHLDENLNVKKDTALNDFSETLKSYTKKENGLLTRIGNRFGIGAAQRSYKEGMASAIRKMASDYGIDGVSITTTSRNAGLTRNIFSRSTLDPKELLAAQNKLQSKWIVEHGKQANALKEGMNTSQISADEYARRSAHLETAEARASLLKGNLKAGGRGGFHFGGKIGAVAGLVGLGAVIGSMFSGGHKSNAELYNPNPQPQYYS